MRATVLGSLVAVAAAVLATAALARIGWPAETYRSSDYFQFWAGPRALLEGGSPYDTVWWTQIHLREGSHALAQPPQVSATAPAWTSPYPPWTQLVLVPFALLPFNLAAPPWLVLQVAAVLAGLAALRMRALLSAPSRDGFLLVGTALAFQPLWVTIVGGNLDGLLFAALAGALAASLAGRAALAGVLLGALALKPHLFLVLVPVYLVTAPDRRTTAIAFAATVTALVGASGALRPDWLAPWLTSVTALGTSAGSNATLWTIDRALPLLPRGVLPAAAALATLGTFAVWWIRTRPLFESVIGAALCVSLALAPHGWSYDLVVLLVTTAIIIELLAHVLVGRRAVGVVLLALVTGVLPWMLYAVAFRRGGEELTVLAPLALLALVVVAERWSRVRPRAWTEVEREGAEAMNLT